MAKLKDFLFADHKAPRFLQQVARRFEEDDAKIKYGKCEFFGYFILLVPKDNAPRVVWVEENRPFMGAFLEQIKNEKPVMIYEKGITAQRPRGSKKSGAEAWPRIYIDKGLQGAGFPIGGRIEVKINKSKQQIIIDLIPEERSE